MKLLSITITLCSIFICSSIFAQEGFRAGLKGGPQSTWMFNADDSDDSDWLYRNTVRSMFGFSLGYNFNDGVGVGLDLIFSSQGQRYELNDLDQFRKLNYFKVPLMLNLNTTPEKVTFGYLNVGPQFSFLMSARQGDVDLGIINLGDEDISEFYNGVTVGGVLAFGAGWNLTDFLQLTTGLRFDFDFTDAEDKDYILIDSDRSPTYNATAALEIGIRYVLRTGE